MDLSGSPDGMVYTQDFEVYNGEDSGDDRYSADVERIKELEIQQEELNISLFSLTSHFAQVQFRLQQIMKVPREEQEHLLKELEEFAFRSCPDVRGSTVGISKLVSQTDEGPSAALATDCQDVKLTNQLRTHLNELDRLHEAATKGRREPEKTSNSVPIEASSIIDRLRGATSCVSEDTIKEICAADQVRHQLKDVISNEIKQMERIVKVLNDIGKAQRSKHSLSSASRTRQTQENGVTVSREKKFDWVSTVWSLLQCGSFGRNEHYPSQAELLPFQSQSSGHSVYQASLFRLESIVENIISVHSQLAAIGCIMPFNHRPSAWWRQPLAEPWMEAVGEGHTLNQNPGFSTFTGKSLDALLHQNLTLLVRKHLTGILLGFLENGLTKENSESVQSVYILNCVSNRRSRHLRIPMHPWELLIEYYKLESEATFSKQSQLQLAETFGADVAQLPQSPQVTLLLVINHIQVSHSRLQRSNDAMFRGFLCCALNEQQLVTWLRIVLSCSVLVMRHYATTAYVRTIGMEGVVSMLSRLTPFKFFLPDDLSVRYITEGQNAFGDPC